MATRSTSIQFIDRSSNRALKYDVHVVFGFTIVGIFLLYLMGKNNGGVFGYGLIGFSLFGLLVFEMAYRKRILQNQSVFTYIKDIFVYGGPLMLLIICVGWLLAINITYKDVIESDSLPSEYNNFQFLGLLILITQLYLLYKYFNDQGKVLKSKSNDIAEQLYSLMSKNISWLMTLLSVIFLIVIGIQQVIVEYFTTDG